MPTTQVNDASNLAELGSSTAGDADMMTHNEEEMQNEEYTSNSILDRLLIRYCLHFYLTNLLY